MHANQRRLFRLNGAERQRKVHQVFGTITIGDQVELAQLAAQHLLVDTFNRALVEQTVVNQVGDGADLDVMLLGKLFQLRATRHAAVVVHDLADHRRLAKPGHAGQIAGRLGMPGTRQHAARLRHQRKDVAGADDVIGGRIRRGSSLHGARAVSGRNTGADADGGLDGDGKLGAKTGAVALHHQRQLQPLAALQTHRHADQATAVASHEVDVLGLAGLGGHDQVAFVLAVFVIHQDDHLAGANIFDQFFDAVQFHPALRGQVISGLEETVFGQKRHADAGGGRLGGFFAQ